MWWPPTLPRSRRQPDPPKALRPRPRLAGPRLQRRPRPLPGRPGQRRCPGADRGDRGCRRGPSRGAGRRRSSADSGFGHRPARSRRTAERCRRRADGGGRGRTAGRERRSRSRHQPGRPPDDARAGRSAVSSRNLRICRGGFGDPGRRPRHHGLDRSLAFRPPLGCRAGRARRVVHSAGDAWHRARERSRALRCTDLERQSSCPRIPAHGDRQFLLKQQSAGHREWGKICRIKRQRRNRSGQPNGKAN